MYLLFKQLFFVQLSFVQRLCIVVVVINLHVLSLHKYSVGAHIQKRWRYQKYYWTVTNLEDIN